MFDNIPFATILVSYVAVLFALSVHEAAHATAAYLLDDDTAASLGRMTLNPIAHMDWLGTLVLPLIGMVTGARVIGWAKPVPVDTSRLNRRFRARVGYAMVAAAGPASNLLQSLIFLLILTLFIRWVVPVTPSEGMGLVRACMNLPVERFLGDDFFSAGQVMFITLLGRLVIINVSLAIFNLLPFGPLDGAGILRGFLPWRWLPTWDRTQPYVSVVLLIGFFITIPGLNLTIIELIFLPFYWLAKNFYLEPLARLILGA